MNLLIRLPINIFAPLLQLLLASHIQGPVEWHLSLLSVCSVQIRSKPKVSFLKGVQDDIEA